jgi:hypothetical protein
MKLRTIVGAALFIFILMIGNILAFGLSQGKHLEPLLFSAAYFAFTAFVCIAGIFFIRKMFEGKWDIIALIIIALLFSGSTVYFSRGVKAYSDNPKFSEQISIAEEELASIKNKNVYYNSYISYLKMQISQSRNKSATLEKKIDSIMVEILNQEALASQAANAQGTYSQEVIEEEPPNILRRFIRRLRGSRQ